MRWWLRNLAIGAAVGLAVGVIVGGTLGRIYMRLVFLAEHDSLGFTTAMGAIIGQFTAGGTGFIYVFAGFAGVALGLAYAASRPLLPPGTRARTLVFVLGTTAFMLGQIVRNNREDFTFLPVTLSLLLTAAAVGLTAVSVPVLVERLQPDRERERGRVAKGVFALGMTGFAVFGFTGILIAYAA